MSAAVLALILQIAWHVVRAALEQAGVVSHTGYISALAFGITVTTDLVIAAAAADCARRLEGVRKTGAWVAAITYLAIAAITAVYEAVLYRSGGGEAARAWVDAMRVYGWGALDAVAVVGFALAAGRRTAWFAPIAVGAALLGGRPTAFYAASSQVVVIAFVALKTAFLIWMIGEGERHAAAPTASRDRAVHGLRRAEVIVWICVGLELFDLLDVVKGYSIYVSLPFAAVRIILDTAMAFVAWSIARSCVAKMPQWLWYLCAIGNGWAAARVARTWFLTLTGWWGRLDQVPLSRAHWSTTIPVAIAAIAAFAAVAVFAWRTGARRLVLFAIATTATTVVAFAFRLALPAQVAVLTALHLVLNIAAARVLHGARAALDAEFPRARVL